MSKLDEIRKEIDLLDDEIIFLLKKRFKLTNMLTDLKPTLTDKNREKEILNKIQEQAIRRIYQTIFSQSKKEILKNAPKGFS